jgi:hypothetical protein
LAAAWQPDIAIAGLAPMFLPQHANALSFAQASREIAGNEGSVLPTVMTAH